MDHTVQHTRLARWRSHAVRYVTTQRTSVAVYAVLIVFAALWAFGALGSYGVTAGTVIGSMALAVSSIGKATDRDKWIIAALGTALVGTCAAVDTLEQLRSLRLKAALEKEFQAYGSNPDHRHQFVSFLNDRLRACVNPVNIAELDADHCDDLESLLEHVDQTNGSVGYYKAEILRLRHRLDDSDDALFGYIEADKRLRPRTTSDNGEASVCDSNGTGYCRQRTAWICHTLANDLYRRGCAAGGTEQRRSMFERAREKMECVDAEYKGGFVQRLGTRPLNTADLTAALGAQLKNPDRTCDALPQR